MFVLAIIQDQVVLGDWERSATEWRSASDKTAKKLELLFGNFLGHEDGSNFARQESDCAYSLVI